MRVGPQPVLARQEEAAARVHHLRRRLLEPLASQRVARRRLALVAHVQRGRRRAGEGPARRLVDTQGGARPDVPVTAPLPLSVARAPLRHVERAAAAGDQLQRERVPLHGQCGVAAHQRVETSVQPGSLGPQVEQGRVREEPREVGVDSSGTSRELLPEADGAADAGEHPECSLGGGGAEACRSQNGSEIVPTWFRDGSECWDGGAARALWPLVQAASAGEPRQPGGHHERESLARSSSLRTVCHAEAWGRARAVAVAEMRRRADSCGGITAVRAWCSARRQSEWPF